MTPQQVRFLYHFNHSRKIARPSIWHKCNRTHITNYQSNELADVLNECPPDKPNNVIEFLVNFIHAEKPQELSHVKTTKHQVTIPAGEQDNVKCNMDQIVFEE